MAPLAASTARCPSATCAAALAALSRAACRSTSPLLMDSCWVCTSAVSCSICWFVSASCVINEAMSFGSADVTATVVGNIISPATSSGGTISAVATVRLPRTAKRSFTVRFIASAVSLFLPSLCTGRAFSVISGPSPTRSQLSHKTH
ncbi:Uncharacterised protein [Mycobacteroides abscessus subsp. abscessus]|nr:Uncharacterised protein [Mycobacteroides abscessus subsp. abscessus]SKV01623.1 Uncharacterised protein [Mycobacteroides abscessus subsp. abscessus]